MPQGFRPNRVADQIRAELGELLAREVHDPGVGFITLTRVHLTPDLRHQVGRRLRLRRVPEIQFTFDESIEQQDRVEHLLAEWHEQTDPKPPRQGEAGDPAAPRDHDDHRPPED
jgi:ribosome-binding factor A